METRGSFEKFADSPYYSESLVFLEAPPLASDALLTKLHQLLENVLQTVCRNFQEDSGTDSFESMDFSDGPRSCSAILKSVLLKRL
jgi:hypothetical protein